MKSKKQKKSTSTAKVKVGKLKVNKETVKGLSDKDLKKVRGGAVKQTAAYGC